MTSEYSKLSSRLDSLKKAMKDEASAKSGTLTPAPAYQDTFDDPSEERIHGINTYIYMNTTKNLANKSKNILDEKLGFSHYINTLNSFRNPDILTGDELRVMKGNKYKAKVYTGEEEKKEGENNEEVSYKL